MASMSNLPAELTKETCVQCQDFNLDPHDVDFDYDRIPDQVVLHNPCHVCRGSKDVAEPLLYDQLYIVLGDLTGHEILELLRTLIDRPELRDRIRCVRLDIHALKSDANALSGPDIKRFEEAARSSGMWAESMQGWEKEKTAREAFLKHLLAIQLQKARTLVLQCSENNREVKPWLSFLKPGNPCVQFSELKTLALYTRKKWCFTPSDFHYLTQLAPKVEFLACEGAGVNLVTAPQLAEMATSAFPVRHVCLFNSLLRPGTAKALLHCFRGLRGFGYIQKDGKRGASPEELRTALETHCETLEEIELWHWFRGEPTEHYGARSFKMFRNLKKLVVHPMDFARDTIDDMGPNPFSASLPHLLELLGLFWWTPDIEKDMKCLAAAKGRGDFANLRTLAVGCFNKSESKVRDTLEKIWTPDLGVSVDIRIF